MAGWALRTFTTREKYPMITLWNSQARPILDYCSSLWSPRPWNYKEIYLLEETLRTFTRYIKGMKDLDYAKGTEIVQHSKKTRKIQDNICIQDKRRNCHKHLR